MEKNNQIFPWEIIDRWQCSWISCAEAVEPPFVTAYRKVFELDKKALIRINVSADERYELFLDGVRIGRGSERGDKNNWFYETYDLQLGEGTHFIVARTWALGNLKPWAQISVSPGFMLSTENEEFIELLGTGIADWEAKKLTGYSFTSVTEKGIGTGGKLIIDGNAFSWGFEKGEGEGWKQAITGQRGNTGYYHQIRENTPVLKSSLLPPMLSKEIKTGAIRFVEGVQTNHTEELIVIENNNILTECAAWKSLLDGDSLVIPANTARRIIIDLENYYCAFPELIISEGKESLIRIHWAESLYDLDGEGNPFKTNRDEINNKYFKGIGDIFISDGGNNRKYDTLWWHAGRYIEVLIHTRQEPLTIASIKFFETRYPLAIESEFECDNPDLQSLIPIFFRSIQMCAHETYVDCPYWEQLMYVGDTRLQALITYVSTTDSRLPRKALQMFDASRLNYTQLINCAYPENSGKIIPSFCFWWVGMVYDYAMWRGDKTFIKLLMPGVRNVVDRLLMNRNESGLVRTPNAWNYIDQTNNAENEWHFGMPPGNSTGISGIFNWHAVYTLKLMTELEHYLDEFELATRAQIKVEQLVRAIDESFWNEEKGLYADDQLQNNFSEHAQCLAILSSVLGEKKLTAVGEGLTKNIELARTSNFFSHYLFEAYRLLNRTDLMINRLAPWFKLQKDGFKTTPELFPGDTRSDCHAWGAHPLYHYMTSLLGIRPGKMGFETVSITPNPGDLKKLSGKLPHPQGEICISFTIKDGILRGFISLPQNISGEFSYNSCRILLQPGRQEIIAY